MFSEVILTCNMLSWLQQAINTRYLQITHTADAFGRTLSVTHRPRSLSEMFYPFKLKMCSTRVGKIYAWTNS